MNESAPEKLEAARSAAALVESGMNVGLGSGSTARLVVRRLGERVRDEGLRIVGVATSVDTAELARECGLATVDLDSLGTLDIDIDGADEVDPQFRLIKGRGGALLHEKIVASAARRTVIVVTRDKCVDRLGRHFPVPVEVSAFGLRHTEARLRDLGAVATLRTRHDGSPFATDEEHRILDCRFPEIADPEELDRRIRDVVGVFETGLFIGLCHLLIVGRAGGAERIEAPAPLRARGST
jgi:ribose 5-phosphate isomerase A